jgi:small multidrug resistance pump
MKPLFGYLFLAVGILFGIASNSFAKISDGFTKLTANQFYVFCLCGLLVLHFKSNVSTSCWICLFYL